MDGHKRRFRVFDGSSYSFHSFLLCIQRMPTAPCPPFSPSSSRTGWRCRISSYAYRPWQAPQAQPPPTVVQVQHQHDLPVVVDPCSRDTPFPNKRIVRLWPFGQGGVGWCVYQCVGGGVGCWSVIYHDFRSLQSAAINLSQSEVESELVHATLLSCAFSFWRPIIRSGSPTGAQRTLGKIRRRTRGAALMRPVEYG
jgi:hypothetical protein